MKLSNNADVGEAKVLRTKRTLLGLLFVAAIVLPRIGAADERTDLPRLSITAGAFLPDTKTILSANSSDGTIGTQIRYEDQLRLRDSDTSLDVGIIWRFAQRHTLELEFFDIQRAGDTVLDVDLQLGDTLFEEQFEVSSFLTTRVTRLGYSYTFLNKPKYRLGLHAGIHMTTIETGVRAIGSDLPFELSEEFDTTAPLPVVGFTGVYRFQKPFIAFARAQYFQLEVGDYDGRMTQFSMGGEYQPFTRWSFGLAYRYFDVDLDITDQPWNGTVDFRYRGPVAYVRFGIL